MIGIFHGPRCRDYGGTALLAELQAHGIAAAAIDRQSLCPHAPVARLPERAVMRASSEELLASIAARMNCPLP